LDVVSILFDQFSEINNILFVQQIIKNLFTLQLRKITNSITDVAGKFDIIRQGGDIKTAKRKNRWVEHVQEFAKKNNIDYCKALCNLDCKSQYRKVIGDGVGSSRISHEQDYNPNIPMAETNKTHQKLKKR
jgi:hypothetical protein